MIINDSKQEMPVQEQTVGTKTMNRIQKALIIFLDILIWINLRLEAEMFQCESYNELSS